ncbi:anti-sigma factor [Sphingomonas sp. TZW2008]|uniref:anti-sigma factor family protein n=1 Tax=Sphingomonas sp. TZW2008 TaxID=1917973 RepID=UPI000A271CA3|nr:hypothetical protein [Sphingomonas sp. TZW2008]
MNISPEMLSAYVDGELDPIAAKRVERAVIADPDLAEELARQRQLRERLHLAFDPIAKTPPPDPLVAMLRASAKVSDIADAHEQRHRRAIPRWLPAGSAVAAALVLGLLIGRELSPDEGPFAVRDGLLVARGDTGKALDTQLASIPAAADPVRILVTFRRTDGVYCRAFETGRQAAIACRGEGEWRVQSLRAAETGAITDYRQAGSGGAALMAEAQEMMTGDPLDAAGERAAIGSRWSRSASSR